MALVLIKQDNAWIALWDFIEDEGLCALSISVGDSEVIAIVNECETTGTECRGKDKTDILLSAEFVCSDYLIYVIENFGVTD